MLSTTIDQPSIPRSGPLLADAIIEEILSTVLARLLGRRIDSNLLLEIKIIIRNVFHHQASIRGLNTYGLEELVDKIHIDISQSGISGISGVTLNASHHVINEIDRYLGNKQCHICNMKIPCFRRHSHDECDVSLVASIMDE
jgi:hypothetical protein